MRIRIHNYRTVDSDDDDEEDDESRRKEDELVS